VLLAPLGVVRAGGGGEVARARDGDDCHPHD